MIIILSVSVSGCTMWSLKLIYFVIGYSDEGRIILPFWVLWPQQLSIKVWFSFKENINGSPTTPSKSSLGNWHCTQKLALHCRQIKDVPPVMSLFLEWQMGVLPGPEAVGVCKLWGIRWPFTSPARNDAESPTYPCYKMSQSVIVIYPLTNDSYQRLNIL